jgi:hypothetical protein
MKRALIIIIYCLAYTTLCIAQRIDLNDAISVSPTVKMTKLSKNEALSSNTFYKKSLIRSQMYHNPDNTYRIDDITVSLNSEKGKIDPNKLLNAKTFYLYLSKANKKNWANIEIVNNRNVLIEYFEADDTAFFQFYTVNSSNTVIVAGQVEFNPGQQVKARGILDDLIKNVKFIQE